MIFLLLLVFFLFFFSFFYLWFLFVAIQRHRQTRFTLSFSIIAPCKKTLRKNQSVLRKIPKSFLYRTTVEPIKSIAFNGFLRVWRHEFLLSKQTRNRLLRGREGRTVESHIVKFHRLRDDSETFFLLLRSKKNYLCVSLCSCGIVASEIFYFIFSYNNNSFRLG